MMGVNKEALVEQIGKANSVLESFFSLPADASHPDIQNSIAAVAECVQGMQPVTQMASTFQDAELKQMLQRYGDYLGRLNPALQEARGQLFAHQRRFRLHLVKAHSKRCGTGSLEPLVVRRVEAVKLEV